MRTAVAVRLFDILRCARRAVCLPLRPSGRPDATFCTQFVKRLLGLTPICVARNGDALDVHGASLLLDAVQVH